MFVRLIGRWATAHFLSIHHQCYLLYYMNHKATSLLRNLESYGNIYSVANCNCIKICFRLNRMSTHETNQKTSISWILIWVSIWKLSFKLATLNLKYYKNFGFWGLTWKSFATIGADLKFPEWNFCST